MSIPAFRTVADPDRPLRLIVVGAGAMGRAWLRTIRACPDAELAAVVDVDLTAARAAVGQPGGADVPASTDLAAIAASVQVDAVVDVTSPAAHLPVTLKALDLGLPVLGEKPLAASMSEALRLIAATQRSGRLFMVSQSRRYNADLFRYREQLGRLGSLGIATTEFFKAPRFGGFRDVMDHPLLLDMAIHPFDTARFLLDAEPVSVYAEEFNPSWSWYRGDAAANVAFEMTGGTRYLYTASWCSPGLETSWNGSWRVSGEHGTARWDGDSPPQVERTDGSSSHGTTADGPPSGIAGALDDFVRALRTGEPPMGEVHDNVMSLAMVESAVLSSRTDRRVTVDDVLGAAHSEAMAAADGEDREVLRSWTSVQDALASGQRASRTGVSGSKASGSKPS